MEELGGDSIDGQFYAEDLTQVKIAKRADYIVGNILESRVGRSSREHLVRWIGYGLAFDSTRSVTQFSIMAFRNRGEEV